MIMKLKSYIVCFTIFFFLYGFSSVTGQVVVQRSKEKTVISGKQYYLHTVGKGETAFSISRAYNITVEELAKANPQTVSSVREGETLVIPFVEVTANNASNLQSTQTSKRDESKYVYHSLKSGETIYSLSKVYGVSESVIKAANPSMDVTKLSIGTELAIPRKDFKTATEQFLVQDTAFFFHRVVKGENLNSIAEYYGIPVRDLRRDNRDVRFPSENDLLKIPTRYAKIVAEEVKPVEPPKIVEQIVELTETPAEYTSLIGLKGQVDVVVLLPLFLDENSVRYDIDSSRYLNGRRVYRTIPRQEEWIYSRSKGFVEMYQGILLAADTLRKLGLDITIHTYDISDDTREMTAIINSGKLANADLIIGPVYSSNLAIVADYASSLDIPVVSPVQLMSNELVMGNPTLFIANPFLHVSQENIAKKVAEYYDGNLVFVHADTAGTNPEIDNFKNKIINELTQSIPYEQIRFKEYFYYNRSAFGNDSINRLSHAISSTLDNVVVIASEESSVISETLQEIHTLSKTNNIHVLGYPVIRGMSTLDPKFFFDLDLCVFSPFWIDYSQTDVRKFVESFYDRFLLEPEEMSYAWSGYDIAYYFISGIAKHGNEFVRKPWIHNPDLIQSKFDFRRETNNNGFENYYLFPIRYTRSYEVRLDEDTTPQR